MAHSTTLDTWIEDSTERRKALPELATARFLPLLLIGTVLVAATGLWWHFNQSDGMGRFWRAYLTSLTYFTSISLGGLFFVVVSHLTGAHWGVVVRRIAEFITMGIAVCAVMWIPIWVSLLSGDHSLYSWNAPGVTDRMAPNYDVLIHGKSAYLNAPFFVGRSIFLFAVWFLIAWYYFRSSVAQDEASDNRPMAGVRRWSGLAMLVFALTLSFGAFDWLMSLEPHWFSTMFGVYYFAGSAVAIFAVLALVSYLLQLRGILTRTVTAEHYHDMGKLLFGFVVFWGYIAFSQFMLIWYADIPEETIWYDNRQPEGSNLTGISTSIALLFVFHFFIPFLGLLSRHVRRHRGAMAFWGLYLLVVHWFDLFYIAGLMPQADGHLGWSLGVTELLTALGLGLVYVGVILWFAAGRWLVPIRDPRLARSLDFENV